MMVVIGNRQLIRQINPCCAVLAAGSVRSAGPTHRIFQETKGFREAFAILAVKTRAFLLHRLKIPEKQSL